MFVNCPTPTPAPKVWWKRYGVLPNGVTFLRILGCFVPMWMIFNPQSYIFLSIILPWWAAALLVLFIVGSTDFVDGWLARVTDSITSLGEKLDPISDKLLVIPTFFAICASGLILQPWGWIIFALTVIPEVALVSLNIYLMVRGIHARIPSIWAGKIKMNVQCLGLVLALLPVVGVWWQAIVIGCFMIGIGFSYVAATRYIQTGVTIIKAAQ